MTAFLFVPLLAATWIVGTFVASQAAHFFLTILESSATPTTRTFSWHGPSFRAWMRDGIEWPDEPFVDHFAKAVYLTYLIALWAGPAVLLGRFAAGATPWATVIAGAAFWLLFPVGLLSSLSSRSRWTPFRLDVLVAFVRRPGATLGFYALSAPVLAVLVLTFDLVLVHGSKVTLAWGLVLAPVAAVLFFVYARLLGRLGLIVTFAVPEEPEVSPARPRRKKRKRPLHAYDERTRPFGPKEDVPDDPPPHAQPPDMPGVLTPYDGEVTGYAVNYTGAAPPAEEPPPTATVHRFDDEDDEPIRVHGPPEISTDRQRVAQELAEPSERELVLHTSSRLPEPAHPYGVETVSFLFDPKTIAPWLTLTAGLAVLALMQRGLDLLRPE